MKSKIKNESVWVGDDLTGDDHDFCIEWHGEEHELGISWEPYVITLADGNEYFWGSKWPSTPILNAIEQQILEGAYGYE